MDKISSFFKHPLYIAIPAFIILILSLLLFAVKPLTTKSGLYIFPDNLFSYNDLEQRNIPQNGNKSENIANYIKELPSGSRDIEMAGFINEKSIVNDVIFRDGILIVDFSKEFNDFENSIPLSTAEVTELLTRNIKLNYNGIDKIIVTIEGQIPGAPFYSLE